MDNPFGSVRTSRRADATPRPSKRSHRAVRLLLALAIMIADGSSHCAFALCFRIFSADAAGVGLRDPTPSTPVGHNPGRTLGEQRAFVVEYAANAWARRLDCPVPVDVVVQFVPLPVAIGSSQIAGGASVTLHANFEGAPTRLTWYPAPLANQLAGADLNDLFQPGRPEISLVVNDRIEDPVVAGPGGVYYGVDGRPGPDALDLLPVILHELAHGLGLAPRFDRATGKKKAGLDDVYTLALANPTMRPSALSQMSDAQRVTAIRGSAAGVSNLLWVGPNVRANSGRLTAGVRADGSVEMHTTPGNHPSAVSHVSPRVQPDELMEPSGIGSIRALRLTTAMLADLGWETIPAPDCGDPSADGRITTVDALRVLAGAVNTVFCDPAACDVDHSDSVVVSDALAVLGASVGRDHPLRCPLF